MCQEGQLDGGGLRVTFHRRGDRIGHTVWLVADEAAVPLLRSAEGKPDEDWPVSPPFQEVDFAGSPSDSTIAYLVGKAGTSHWSMSVALEPKLNIFHFDVACRIQSAPDHLGSRYRAFQPVENDGPVIDFHASDKTARLMIEERGGGVAETRLAREIDSTSEGSIIDVCVPTPPPPFPRTVQWGYRIARRD